MAQPRRRPALRSIVAASATPSSPAPIERGGAGLKEELNVGKSQGGLVNLLARTRLLTSEGSSLGRITQSAVSAVRGKRNSSRVSQVLAGRWPSSAAARSVAPWQTYSRASTWSLSSRGQAGGPS